jgi:hypothetical protein
MAATTSSAIAGKTIIMDVLVNGSVKRNLVALWILKFIPKGIL